MVVVRKKRFNKLNRWSAKYRKDVKLWIPHFKITYLYWFKFLQIAIKEKRKIDWSKYEGWGGENYIMATRFDDFWKENWINLFSIKEEGNIPKFPLNTPSPKTDAVRYSLILYENKHRGSNWDIAIWTKKMSRKENSQNYFIEFWDKIDEHMITKTKLVSTDAKRQVYDDWGKDNKKWVGGKSDANSYDEDSDAYLNRFDKEYVQSLVGRYLRNAEKHLKNVCKGEFGKP